MTSEDSDYEPRSMTRREALSGGSAAAVAVGSGLLAKTLVGQAQAQTGTEPRIQLGQDWQIDDKDDGSGNTDIAIEHIPTGNSINYDVNRSIWNLDIFEGDMVNTKAGPDTDPSFTTDDSFTVVPIEYIEFGDSSYWNQTNNTFSPPRDKQYQITQTVRLYNLSGNARVRTELYNETDSYRTQFFMDLGGYNSFNVVQLILKVNLLQSKEYSFRIAVDDSGSTANFNQTTRMSVYELY